MYRELLRIDLPAYNISVGGKRVPPKDFVRAQVKEESSRAWQEVQQSDAKCFDLIVLRYFRPCDHIAILTEDPKIMLVTDRLFNSHLAAWGKRSEFWGADRIEGVYRYVGA